MKHCTNSSRATATTTTQQHPAWRCAHAAPVVLMRPHAPMRPHTLHGLDASVDANNTVACRDNAPHTVHRALGTRGTASAMATAAAAMGTLAELAG